MRKTESSDTSSSRWSAGFIPQSEIIDWGGRNAKWVLTDRSASPWDPGLGVDGWGPSADAGRGRHAGGKASWGWAAEGAATIYKETPPDCHV